MKTPRKAVILSAGLGTRMRPLTLIVPKPMLTLGGVPMLERQIGLLEKWGVRDILINVHHLPNAIVSYIRGRKDTAASITLSMEPTVLGTGGAIKRAEWFFEDDPFWIINSDIFATVSPKPLLRLFEEEQPMAALWMTRKAGPRTVAMSGNRIINFRSPAPGSPITATFCGLHLVSPAVLPFIPAGMSYSIIDAYSHAMAKGHPVLGTEVNRSTWIDLGTPDRYLQAHAMLTRKLKKPVGTSEVATDAQIDKAARISNSVVYEGAILGPDAHVKDAIIAPETKLNCNCSYMAMPCIDLHNRPLSRALTKLGWSEPRTTALPLPPRGSSRSFTRLRFGRKRMMMVTYGLERTENAYHARNSTFLTRIGMKVPRIFLHDARNRLILMEDVGDNDLKQIVSSNSCETEGIYKGILDDVYLLHSKGTKRANSTNMELPQPFTASLYKWEHDLFINNYLPGRIDMTSSALQELRDDLYRLGAQLARMPRVLIHRDLQSTNVLLHKKDPVFIDFQGMRMGAAAYDLASLLSDPYVSLAEETQLNLLDYYSRISKTSFNALQNTFWKATTQRLVQALGAYGRLCVLPGMEHFKEYITPALTILLRALNHLDVCHALRDTANEGIVLN